MSVKNSKTLPKVYYGLHMAPGVAEYREPGKEPYRILINENAIKKMDATFPGRPVYVEHVSEVNLDNIQAEADGYVVESFYNSSDGKHWVKFIVVSDRGHEAITSGWRLSNAYHPKSFSNGGMWHGVEFQKEVTDGEYEHLAIVRNPRYDESVIFTPEQFKEYNLEKENELMRIANSKDEQGEKSVLSIFKKTKVENSLDVEQTMVTLPLSKVDMSIAQLVNAHDAILNMHGYANGDHLVKVGDADEMSVNDLAQKYCEMKKNMEDEAAKKKENLDEGEKDSVKEEKKADKTENEIEVTKVDHFKDLKDAPFKVQNTQKTVDLSGVERGKSRYGAR